MNSGDTRVLDISADQRFRLSDDFLSEFAGSQPRWGPLGEFVYKRTYARDIWLRDDSGPIEPDIAPHIFEIGDRLGQCGRGATEEYWMTCARVVEGAFTVLRWHADKHSLARMDEARERHLAQDMYRRMWQFKWLPSGRGLAKMGTRVIEKIGGAALNSCAFVTTEDINKDFSSPFKYLMDMAMLGVGVGLDTRGAGKVVVVEPEMGPVHVVEDSREGWVEAVGLVLDAYAGHGPLPSSFDYSRIRAKGSRIMTFGGVASGPEPLRLAIERLLEVFRPMVGQVVSSDTIVRVANIIGVAVVSGNVRRTAEILLGEPDDEEFLSIKDPTELNALQAELDSLVASGGKVSSEGRTAEEIQALIDALPLRQYLWASNNSTFSRIGQSYTRLAKQTATNGEPAYYWLDTAREYGRLKDPPNWIDARAAGGNPCLEQTLESYEMCNLVENFPSMTSGRADFEETLSASWLYAKAVTLIPTHDPRSNAVMARNRRVGSSLSGIVLAMNKFGTRQFLDMADAGYAHLAAVDVELSEFLAVPPSIKRTSVKPSGSVSQLPGVTPGIHDDHSEYYWRLVTVPANSPLVQAYEDAGYRVEDYVYSPGTKVIYFPVHQPGLSRRKHDVSMWEQLERAAQLQYYWADNQVSVTVNFKPEEAEQIAHALELYETRLKSVSFLPLDGGGYAQAPYQEITREEYEAAVAKLSPVDLSRSVHEVDDKFCDGNFCEVKFD